MSREPSPPIPNGRSSTPDHCAAANTLADQSLSNDKDPTPASASAATGAAVNSNNGGGGLIARRERPSRACTARSAARIYAAVAAETAAVERKPKAPKRVRYEEPPPPEEEEEEEKPQCSSSRIVTPLVGSPPPPSQFPRWSLRSMWELASVLNFLHVFRPLLNISVEFSVEELETALITAPNDILSDIHIPLLKAIPPVTRMALGRNTWVTVLCRKLRDWWYWVADGEIPIVASHGAEVDLYNTLDPSIRVMILKALCDIRVEQEDIRNYIEDSIKHGVQLSTFRKERIGGDSHGISYWYEDDPIIGHRLYREIRKVEVKKDKKRGVHPLPTTSYLWETVATNFDEFQNVSEKLFSSKNRTEVSLGKKLKIDVLPEVEKVHKRKEKLLKKQHRQALLLDSFVSMDGLGPGRSLRDRKPVTYTFDDYDRSINEAIKITKWKQPSPDPTVRREELAKPEASTNGTWNGPSHDFQNATFSALSPASDYDDDIDEDHKLEMFDLDHSTRRRQRPQRYSEKEFVEAVSDNEAGSDSDDDIVGEAVYDEEYLKARKKRRKLSSSSEGEGEGEGDEEYRGDEENAEDEEEEEESLSASEDSDDEPQGFKKMLGRTRRGAKFKSVNEVQAGLRRSRRATRNRINYRQYELSESGTESMELEKSNALSSRSDTSDNGEYSGESQGCDGNDDGREVKVNQHVEDYAESTEERNQLSEKINSPDQREPEGVRKRRFLDLNELAPGSGFDDGPNPLMR